MIAQKNIIKKVEIGVNTPSLSLGMQLKDGLDLFFKEEIFPAMDEYFNSIQKNSSSIVRIDNISIDISFEENNSINELKSLIINKLKKIINNEIISDKVEGNFTIISLEQKETDAFFHFLKNGTLPWWLEKKGDFLNLFIKNFKWEKKITKKLEAFFSNSEIRKRLVYQFDDAQLFQIISSFLNISKEENLIAKIPATYRLQFWEAIMHFSVFQNEKEVGKIFQNISNKDVSKIQEISKRAFGLHLSFKRESLEKKEFKNTVSSEFEKEPKALDLNSIKEENEIVKEGILVKNAGLILLHPFLKTFFEKMDFLTGKFIKTEKIDEAIHALHYLATGKEQAYEHDLVFEKFLCDVPIHQPINRHFILSKEQKIACEVLLQAVLEHWSALKSKSTEILQNEFLQREGKLIISEEKQTLIVARKTQDILLDKLPWNINLVKVPWIEKIVFVEW
jgi:hypothetical protein